MNASAVQEKAMTNIVIVKRLAMLLQVEELMMSKGT
jgi:hypothetical protein